MLSAERAKAYRLQVAALLEAVLSETITPRTALNSWPRFCNADPSVACAYTFLWYFEADQDRRLAEMFYADLQLKTLQEIVTFLKQGLPLTPQLMSAYAHQPAALELDEPSPWTAIERWLQAQGQLLKESLQLAFKK